MTLRDVLHMAEERAAVMRVINMDRDRDDDAFYNLYAESLEMSDKIRDAIETLPTEQRQQLIALYDPLRAFTY
jgi:DNA-directed RNA polymerase specialized sigma24 family protein